MSERNADCSVVGEEWHRVPPLSLCVRAVCGPAGLLWVERRDRRPRELRRENVSIPSHPCQATRGWLGPLAPLPAGRMELWSWELVELCNFTVGELEREYHFSFIYQIYQGDFIIIASDFKKSGSAKIKNIYIYKWRYDMLWDCLLTRRSTLKVTKLLKELHQRSQIC